VLVNGAALHRHAVPDRGDGLVDPRRAVDDEEFGTPQPSRQIFLDHWSNCALFWSSHFGVGMVVVVQSDWMVA
jgi:hypothetical protein